MKVLAIESSCDETGAAVVEKKDGLIKVLSNKLATSSEMHEKYGGIVPEVAAREQIRSIIPVIDSALKDARTTLEEIDGLAVTAGPGLIGSLLVGVETVKALSIATGKHVMGVNHIAGHVFACWIDKDPPPRLPALALVVSGGHSEFLLIEEDYNIRWLGGTKDDAVGECFDKCARALKIGYPGGPKIEQVASTYDGKEVDFKLPLPLLEDGLEMSFSGLKTAVVRLAEQGYDTASIAWSVNQTVTKILTHKTLAAIEQVNPQSLVLGGGVAANKLLRTELQKIAENKKLDLYLPSLEYCTDNAAMIGAAALLTKKSSGEIKANPSWELGL